MGKSESPIDLAAPEQSVGHSNLALVQHTLTEFDKVAAGLAELTQKYGNVVYPVATTLGMAEAKAARIAIREPRYAVDKGAKAAKDPLNALKRDIDARALQITTVLVDLETPIHEQIKAQEDLVIAEKAAKAEAARVESLRVQGDIDAIRMCATVAVGKSRAEIDLMRIELAKTETTIELYGERAGEALQAKMQSMATLDSMHAAAVIAEAQAEQMARDRKELEDMRAAQAERELEAQAKRAAEERAAQEKQAAEQKAEADKLAADRAAFEKARAQAIAALEKQEAEFRAAQQADAEKRAAEQKRLDDIAAAERAETERKARAERDEAERIAREAREAEQRRLDEEATARRATEEAAHAADKRMRDAAKVMLHALQSIENDDQHMPDAIWTLICEAIELATGEKK